MLKKNFLWLLLCASFSANAQNQTPRLLNAIYQQNLADAQYGFEHPQDSARTKAWWFHGETETTKAGITADLEAFKRAGVGGVVYYDQSHGKAEHALEGFSPEWWDMFRFSATEAKRVGLSFEVHISNGFVAGGRWISHEHSMKRLAVSETVVRGGREVDTYLEQPMNKYGYSKDVAVLAFPARKGIGVNSLNNKPTITSNESEIDLVKLVDPKATDWAIIPKPRDQKAVYINFTFDEPFEARSITYEVRPRGLATTSATNVPAPPQETFVGTGYRILPDLGQLEVSDDGVHYRKVCDLKPVYRAHENWRQKSVSFPAVKGKHYRLNLHDWWEENEPSPDMQLGKLILNGAAKIDQWEEKAGFFSEYMEADLTPSYALEESIALDEILDISDELDADGRLHWKAPAGDWLVMRLAYVPTGGASKHGRKNLMGFECDKLSVAAAKVHWKNYVGVMIDSLKKAGIDNLVGVAMDSHEAGTQNWTPLFREEFAQRRGYNPTLFLPAMFGYIIDNPERTRSFLYDVRRSVADMVTDNYYGTFQRLCEENNLVFTAQATGNALCIVADPIQAKSKVAKPQGEFWQIHPDGNYDIKESSSAAHLYNKQIASAEAYTDAKYSASLADLKYLADYAYTYGINEFVICASAYQPWLDSIPGSTGGGRHYCINRNNTWWDYSRSFWNYQARAAYILRQGKQQTDIALYLGDDAPVKILTHRLPELPAGYDFDAFTADALIRRMDSDTAGVVLPDGHRYKLIVLPRSGRVSWEALQKMGQLIKQGAWVYGNKPVLYGSQRDLDKQAAFDRLVQQIWGDEQVNQGSHRFGKGRVLWGMSLGEALAEQELHPDVALAQGDVQDRKLYFVHRKLTDADVYFLANHKDEAEQNRFTFRTGYRYAQLWDLVSGRRYQLDVKSVAGGQQVDLQFAGQESAMIVWTNQKEELPVPNWLLQTRKTIALDQDWKVTFDPKWGGSGEVLFKELIDWTQHSEKGIKYYSGTAIYKKTVQLHDLGKKTLITTEQPGSVARVLVNGKEAGTIWCAPWQLDISAFVKEGENEIEIQVANSLINRMVYDEQLPEKDRVTYAFPSIVSKDDALIPSGLRAVHMLIMD